MVGLKEFTRLTRKAKVSPDAHYNPLVHSTLMRSWLTLQASIIVGVVGWASAQRSSQKESRGSALVRVGISQLAASYSDRPVCLAHPFLTVIAFHTFVSNPHGMMHIALGTVEVARSRGIARIFAQCTQRSVAAPSDLILARGAGQRWRVSRRQRQFPKRKTPFEESRE
ncbi:hypothetical protein FA13DRAFT_1739312 [Coprinellus micaceus]|uniref:Uncharacterized protein n=1 Tax=Coprinellus micaceus TaxID=71717 RepID=A0A4Y7SRK9_COPMI|nr:hypothetical protein FA13DRAFT_1739312 [Coprinellus micaceus]